MNFTMYVVRTYVHMYVCTYVCMYVCMYVRMYVHVCMYVCMYVCKKQATGMLKSYVQQTEAGHKADHETYPGVRHGTD